MYMRYRNFIIIIIIIMESYPDSINVTLEYWVWWIIQVSLYI
jgi:hypothetical protein